MRKKYKVKKIELRFISHESYLKPEEYRLIIIRCQ